MNNQQLLKFDQEHIWHPYSSVTQPLPMYLVESAKGTKIKLADGRQLIDGMASWWSTIHGYNHDVLNAAVENQLKDMSHVMFGGLTHKPAIELCQLLVDITPVSQQKVFLSDSGSVAVEVAIKMALQYWHAKGKSHKNRLVCLNNAYHGDTFGAMATCDPVNGMHHLFADVLPKHYFVDSPACGFYDNCEEVHLQSLKNTLDEHHREIAGLILEPIVQGAGGMKFYAPEFLHQARLLCDEYDVLLILDEIATGFGRTGKMFASEHASIEPDIMCVGKALTGGYMTLAATLCNNDVAETICHGEAGVFMHGPTFMANPMACAVAKASINLLLAGPWQENVQRLEREMTKGLAEARKLDSVADVRVLGGIGVIEMNEAVDMGVIQQLFVDHGAWVRPFGKLVYVMPAYIMPAEELELLCKIMVDVVSTI